MLDLAEHLAEVFGDVRYEPTRGASVHSAPGARVAAYRERNPDKVRAWRRARYLRDGERARAQAASYYAAHREQISARRKATYASRKKVAQ